MLKKYLKSMERVLTKYIKPCYNRLTKTQKGENMSNAKKICISLNGEVLKKGKAKSEEMGIPFSTYLSILISNDTKKKERK